MKFMATNRSSLEFVAHSVVKKKTVFILIVEETYDMTSKFKNLKAQLRKFGQLGCSKLKNC